MKYTINDLLELNHNDLISTANSEFSLGVSKKFTKKEIAAMIVAAQSTGRYDNSKFEILRGEKAEAAKQEDLPPGYCILRINRSDYNPSGQPIPIGIQGKQSLAPVGVDFKAPEWILENLYNAIREKLVWNEDQGTHDVILEYSYPFTVIKHNPSEKWPEIEARRKYTQSRISAVGA